MPSITRLDLLNRIDARFSDDDARDLAFALGLDWANLGGETKRGKLRALFLRCESLGKTRPLMQVLTTQYATQSQLAPGTTYAPDEEAGSAPQAAGSGQLPAVARRPRAVAVDLSHNQAQWDDYKAAIDTAAQGLPDVTFEFIDTGLRPAALRSFAALVLAPPWHTVFTPDEIRAVDEWVAEGNGLLLLGAYTAGVHHACNVNDLACKFRVEFSEDLLMPPAKADYGSCRGQARGHRNAAYWLPVPCPPGHPLVQGVGQVALTSACSLTNFAVKPRDLHYRLDTPECAVMRAVGHKGEHGYMPDIDDYVLDCRRPALALAAWAHQLGHVVAVGTWKFLLPIYQGYDNARLFTNSITWLLQG